MFTIHVFKNGVYISTLYILLPLGNEINRNAKYYHLNIYLALVVKLRRNLTVGAMKNHHHNS